MIQNYIGNGVKSAKMSGDNVHLAFASTAAGVAPQQMIVLDANFVPRVLKPYERLVLDDLAAEVSAGFVDLCILSTLASSTLIAAFGPNSSPWTNDAEGMSLPLSTVPWVIPNSTSSTAFVHVTGSGRIMEGSTQGVRPNWREATVRGD
jgi:hypothetical protein